MEHDSGNATREALAYVDGNLARLSERNEHHRSEALRDNIHHLFGWGLKGAFLLYGLAVVAVCWHYLMPWPWLTPDQLHTVTTVVLSGAITSKGSQYLSRRVR